MKKTPTIFTRDPNNLKLVINEQNPKVDWVFNGEGVATRKYDGTCSLIRNGVLYKRRELKINDVAPVGFEQADFDPETNKTVGWVPVSADNPADQWHIAAFDNRLKDGTYELLGIKIQGNPEKISGHILLAHADAQVMDAPRTFEALREWLADKDIEGLVFHHPDGRMAKIKLRDFGLERK